MGNKNFLLENVGAYVCLNGEIIEAQRYADETPDGDYWTGDIVYEVIRVISGVPMFFEDYCARLNESLARLNIDAEIGMFSFLQPIASLLRANNTYDCNIKLWAASGSPGIINLFLNINKSFYPPPEYYRDGAPAGLYAYTRENPNVKQVVQGYKEQVQALIESGGVFELLLYDNTNHLTEGSRSNLFFSRGNQLFTAPDRIILKGTVRKYVFLAAQRAGVEIVERPVSLKEIGLSPGSLDRRRAHGKADADRFKTEVKNLRQQRSKKTIIFPTPGPWPGSEPEPALPVMTVNGAFLTGTSIGVLPISRIGGVKLNSAKDRIIRRIMAEYDKITRDYINSRK